ncbi:MAG: hypothetical protein IPL79_17960 [Myxococcales bacterium]|nr:hypothetical protein [Myxococcales bacterium]
MLGMHLLAPTRWAVVIAAALAACSDNRPPTEPPTVPLPGEPNYTTPEGFSRRHCVAGSMAGQATPGIFHGRYDADQFSNQLTMRIDAAQGGALAVQQNGHSVVSVSATDDYFFTLRDNGQYQTAMFFCRVDAQGTWHGQLAFIFSSEDGEGNVSMSALLGEVFATRVEPLDEAPAQGLTLLGEFRPEAWSDISVNVRVRDGIAYMANYHGGLDIVDVGNPAAPIQLGHLDVRTAGEIYNDVKVTTGPGNQVYAIMAGSGSGAVVINVSDPANPSEVTTMGEPTQLGDSVEVHTLFIDASKAYLANTRRGVEIYDIADPTAPVKLGELRINSASHYLHDLYVSGDRAYLNYWNSGMVIVDVSDPTAPTRVDAFTGYGENTNHSCWVTTIGDRDVAITGDEQYGAHAYLVDVTENTPGFLSIISEWQTRPEVSIHNIMAFGPLVFISHYQDGIRVLDISVPETPALVAWYNTWPGYPAAEGASFFEGAVGIDYDPIGQLVYVADATRGLIILSFDVAP